MSRFSPFRFLQKMNLRNKATLMMGAVALLTAIVIGGTASYVAREATLEVETKMLTSLRDARRDELVDYLNTIDEDLLLWSESSVTEQAVQEFTQAWNAIEGDAGQILQNSYIEQNPNPLGEKDKMTDSAIAPEAYAEVHSKLHPIYRKLKDVRGYYDVFLFDTNGNLIYSVYKELDYATNLVNGNYADSGLGRVFRAAVKGETVFDDFAAYAPSHGAAASFIARPVRGPNGNIIGVLAFQMPVDRIDAVLAHTESLGGLGALLLVGDDNLLRHNSPRFEGTSILTEVIDTDGVRLGLDGAEGVVTATHHGVDMLEAYLPIDFHGVKYAFVAEMSYEDVYAPVAEMQMAILTLSLAVLLIVLTTAYLIARGAVRPIIGIQNAVVKLADGNNMSVPGQDRFDEIGDLARSMERIYQKGLEAARLRSALDSCSTMVMVANQRLEIVYANTRLDDMLHDHASAIRDDIPAFDPDNLHGCNIDTFHKMPEKTRALIEGLTRPHSVNLTLGGLRLELSINPVINENGNRIGTVVEWYDHTAQIELQESMAQVVDAAGRGRFDVTVPKVEGGEAVLVDGVNKLVSVIEGVTTDFGELFAAMADGDLSRSITTQYEGKFGELQNSTNATVSKLGGVLEDIKEAVDQMENASSRIQADSGKLAERTEATAASLEETSASTTQITQTVRETAERSGVARELAQSTSDVAAQGKSIADESVEAINAIDADADKVAGIVSVIDEISFQTNLLALNASVEAARAGEAGKGFAVVASEVRTLAQRSSDAAASIRELITSSNAQVKNGVTLAHRVGESLQDIVTKIDEVTTIVSQISNAADEQAQGISEISASVSQMDEITQRNAAMVQETNGAAHSLVSLSRRLAATAEFFKSGNSAKTTSKDRAA